MATVDRSVNASGFYTSRTSVAYTCPSSNTTPCNTPDKLKRSIIATSLPNNEPKKQFDTWIVPTFEFNSSSCFNYSNLTKGCPETDLVHCQKCIISVSYAQQIDVRVTCPAENFNFNSIEHGTMFYLDNRTEAHSSMIRCQMGNDCNSIENNAQVRQKLIVTFDYNKFFSSIASVSKVTIVILLSNLRYSHLYFLKFNNTFFKKTILTKIYFKINLISLAKLIYQ